MWDAERVARQRPDVEYHVFDLADASREAVARLIDGEGDTTAKK